MFCSILCGTSIQMQNLFTSFLFCLTSVISFGQLQHDSNGDGSVGAADLVSLLAEYGTVQPTSTMYFFRATMTAPFYNTDLINPSNPFYLIDNDGAYIETTDFVQALEWALDLSGASSVVDNGGNVVEVTAIDSLAGIYLPLGSSIGNGDIIIGPTPQVGYDYFVIKDDVGFPFEETAVFFTPGLNCEIPWPLTRLAFDWNGEAWSLYAALDYTVLHSGERAYSVSCGY